MRLPFGLFVVVAAAILGSWWWLGAPVAMPPSPLAANEKLYCVSYAPFRGRQTPLDSSTHIDKRQIEEDLERLARLTDCVRTYATDAGLDQVVEIAGRHGLQVIQGLWIGREAARNALEIDTVVGLAERYPGVIRSIVVGNEALLRGEIGPEALATIIRGVKARVTVPVTYAEVWEFWLRAREVYDAVDFVTIHILPYWEDFPIAAGAAAAHVDAIRRKVAGVFPGKEILIGEVGWPSAGRMREGALPSPADQARVIHEVLALARRENFHVNVIEAFDQPWKENLEGTVGGHWGLLDADSRELKFAWGQAISNHPHWRLQAAEGVALALMVFVVAAAQRARKPPAAEPPIGRWLAIAVVALVPGILVGWAIENALVESLGIGGSMRSATIVALAVGAPLACAAALSRQTVVPPFWRVLGRAGERPVDRLVLALGVLFVCLTIAALQTALELVFDPRYRDFVFAPLTAAALPFLVLTLARNERPEGRRAIAETVAAAVLAGCAVYIVFNEGFENWQALWLCAALAMQSITLFRSRDGRSSG